MNTINNKILKYLIDNTLSGNLEWKKNLILDGLSCDVENINETKSTIKILFDYIGDIYFINLEYNKESQNEICENLMSAPWLIHDGDEYTKTIHHRIPFTNDYCDLELCEKLKKLLNPALESIYLNSVYEICAALLINKDKSIKNTNNKILNYLINNTLNGNLYWKRDLILDRLSFKIENIHENNSYIDVIFECNKYFYKPDVYVIYLRYYKESQNELEQLSISSDYIIGTSLFNSDYQTAICHNIVFNDTVCDLELCEKLKELLNPTLDNIHIKSSVEMCLFLNIK